MEIKIVCGAQYGDEGRGVLIDHFSEQSRDSKLLNIKLDGSCNDGHKVVKGKNLEYTFRLLGAGTFDGADTFFSEGFIINLEELKKELDKLSELGFDNLTDKIFVDAKAMVEVDGIKVNFENALKCYESSLLKSLKLVNHVEAFVRSYETIIVDCSSSLYESNYSINKVHDAILKYRLNNENVELCYVMRSYVACKSRYNLKNEVRDTDDLSSGIKSGAARFGIIDVEETYNNILNSSFNIMKEYSNYELSLAVTHLDETDGMLCTTVGKLYLDETELSMLTDKIYMCSGKRADDILV